MEHQRRGWCAHACLRRRGVHRRTECRFWAVGWRLRPPGAVVSERSGGAGTGRPVCREARPRQRVGLGLSKRIQRSALVVETGMWHEGGETYAFRVITN